MRKGVINPMVALIGIAILILVLSPSIRSSVISAITGEPEYCMYAPYDENCICPDGERKIYVPWVGVPRWSCENVENLVLDPESPTFEQDAIDFTKAYLNQYCGDICSDLSCGDMSTCIQGIPPEGKDKCIEATYGYDESGNRLANIECKVVTEWDSSGRATTGYISWGMEFYVESETGQPMTRDIFITNNFCYNTETETKCAMPEYCEYYNNPDWCVGNLPLEIVD